MHSDFVKTKTDISYCATYFKDMVNSTAFSFIWFNLCTRVCKLSDNDERQDQNIDAIPKYIPEPNANLKSANRFSNFWVFDTSIEFSILLDVNGH